MSELPCAVPLTELLRRIPKDARLTWKDADGVKAWHSVPIGRYAHEAADELDRRASPPAQTGEQVVRALVNALETIECRAHEARKKTSVELRMDLHGIHADAIEALNAHKAALTHSPGPAEARDAARYREWFDAVQDLNPSFLTADDYRLAIALYQRCGMRVPKSVQIGAAIDAALSQSRQQGEP